MGTYVLRFTDSVVTKCVEHVSWQEQKEGMSSSLEGRGLRDQSNGTSRKGTLQVTVPLVMARSCHPGLLVLVTARTYSPAHGGPLPRLEVAPGRSYH